jgi:hypothetical protein
MNARLPDYQKNEIPIDEVFVPPSNLEKLVNKFKVIGQCLENLLIRKNEFKIWHGEDRLGHELWKVYDPRTNRQVYLASEEEVRTWIEESFYSGNREIDRSINSFDLYQHRLFF